MQLRSNPRMVALLLLGALVLVATIAGADGYLRHGSGYLGTYATIVVPIVLFFMGVVLVEPAAPGPGHAAPTGTTPALDPRRLAADFLARQHADAQRVPIDRLFSGRGRVPGRAGQVHLSDIYVPLDVVEVEPDAVHRPEFRRLCFARIGGDSLPLTRALAEGIERSPRGLRAVLVGEAGSGKSSAVADLMHRCRPGSAPGSDWPAVLRGRAVLRFDLRLLAARPAAAGGTAPPGQTTDAFWSALRGELCRLQRRQELPCPLDPGQDAVHAAIGAISEDLRAGGLLLLDGFDEVEDPARRQEVRTLVEALGRELGPHCAVLVTARPYVYPAAALDGFVVWRLQPLSRGDLGQAEDLVARWHRVLHQDAGATAGLLAALAQDPERAELATRPLLLTLLIALGLARRGAELRDQARVAARVILDGAGLLFARGGGSLGYVHRLFQEYLAACALVSPPAPAPGEAAPPSLVVRLRARLRGDPAAWREVTRFAAVRLARLPGGPTEAGAAAPAIALVRGLLTGAGPTAAGDRDYQVALAAGLALADLRAAVAPAGLEPSEAEDLADAGRALDAWFLRLVDDPAPAPQTRRDFGRLMGRLGREPRPGIVPAAWTVDPGVPFALDLARDFDWVAIGAGPFTPGSGPDDDLAFDDEHGGTAVELPAFSITRYPVTCAQFAAFTRAGGYGGGATPPPWWREVSEAAVEWWHGGNPGLEQALADPDWSDENKQTWQDWLARRGPEARRRPWFEGDPQYADWLLPNHPVIGVSWFEAMAFCRWLSGLEQARANGWAFRLPSEIEWERAARGPQGHRWPWGNDWRDDACNGAAARLGSTSAVGVFPYPSAEGLRDLAGNVWEWTQSRWGPRLNPAAFGWPLVPDDGRDDPGGADLRVMRGGSWYGEAKDTPRWCRGAYRGRDLPDSWNNSRGVRVLRVSLAVSVS